MRYDVSNINIDVFAQRVKTKNPAGILTQDSLNTSQTFLHGHYGSTAGTKLQEVGTNLLEDVDESVSSWEPDGMAAGKGKSD